MASYRAQAGGESGVNGEWYEGGQYLPSSATTVKGEQRHSSSKAAKVRKMEVAPYVWEMQPTPNSLPLYGKISAHVRYDDQGRVEFTGNVKAAAYYGYTPSEINELAERFNRGERWFIKEG